MTTEDQKKFLEDLLPQIKSTVWQAALICSTIVGAVIYAMSRVDIAELRNELKQMSVSQTQNVRVEKQTEDPITILARENHQLKMKEKEGTK